MPNIATRRTHICGPPPMMQSVKTALVELSVVEANIKSEAFGTIKRNLTAKRALSNEIAGRVMFQASDATAPVRGRP